MKPSEEARAGLRLPVTGVSSSGRPRGRSISGRRVPEARRAGPGRAPRPAERAAHGLLGGPRIAGTDGQRFGRAGHLIRNRRDSTGPASLRAVSRVSRSRGAGGNCELPGAVPGGRSAPGPHPCPQDRPPRQGSPRPASRRTADSEDAGSGTQLR